MTPTASEIRRLQDYVHRTGNDEIIDICNKVTALLREGEKAGTPETDVFRDEPVGVFEDGRRFVPDDVFTRLLDSHESLETRLHLAREECEIACQSQTSHLEHQQFNIGVAACVRAIRALSEKEKS